MHADSRQEGGGVPGTSPPSCLSAGSLVYLNFFGNWSMIPMLSISAMPRIWVWIWS